MDRATVNHILTSLLSAAQIINVGIATAVKDPLIVLLIAGLVAGLQQYVTKAANETAPKFDSKDSK